MSLFDPELGDEGDAASDSMLSATLAQAVPTQEGETWQEFWVPSAVERIQMRWRNSPGWQNIPPPTPLIPTIPLPILPNEVIHRTVNPVLLYQAGDNSSEHPGRSVRGIDLRHPSLLSVVSDRIGGAPLHLDRTSVVKPEVREVTVYHPDLHGEYIAFASNGYDVSLHDLFSALAEYIEEEILRDGEQGFDMEAHMGTHEPYFSENGRNESQGSGGSMETLRRIEILGSKWSLKGFSWEEETEKLRIWTRDGDME